MPTLLELSGLKSPDGIQGDSLVPLVTATAAQARVPAQDRLARTAGRSEARNRPAISEKPSMPDVPGAGLPPRAKESVSLILDGWKLIHNSKRVGTEPVYELYDHRKDPLDRVDLAARHPEVVHRLAKLLDGWRVKAEKQRLKKDSEALSEMSPEQLNRLRSLGYIQ
jgi:arylsulfatase A-like enzyme